MRAVPVELQARRRLRAAVNFGVASTERVLGAPPDRLLELRCECGGAGCAQPVRITLREYLAAQPARRLLVVPEHAGSARVPATGT